MPKTFAEALSAAVAKQGKPEGEIKSLNLDCSCRCSRVEVGWRAAVVAAALPRLQQVHAANVARSKERPGLAAALHLVAELVFGWPRLRPPSLNLCSPTPPRDLKHSRSWRSCLLGRWA